MALLPFLGGILSGAAALIGVTKKPPKPEAPGVDYMKLRAEAEAAGFNPLTALMYGGSSAYTRDYGPALSRQATTIGAMQAFADTLLTIQQQADQRRAQEAGLKIDQGRLDLDRDRLEAETRYRSQIAGAVYGPVFGPSATTGVGTRYEDTAAAYGPGPAALDGAGLYAWHGLGNLARAAGGLVATAAGPVGRAAWSLGGALPSLSREPLGARLNSDLPAVYGDEYLRMQNLYQRRIP